MKRADGFTLVETLIALAVFAIIAGASTGILSTALKSGDANAATSRSMAKLSFARSIMRDDFLQIVPRPVRDPFGRQTQSSFEGGFVRDRITIARLARRGRVNPGGRQPRGGVQHVQYLFDDNKIIRRTYPVIDPTPDTEPYDQILFDDVEGVTVRFLINGQWQSVFEASNSPTADLPSAISLFIKGSKGDQDQLRLVFQATGERLS